MNTTGSDSDLKYTKIIYLISKKNTLEIRSKQLENEKLEEEAYEIIELSSGRYAGLLPIL